MRTYVHLCPSRGRRSETSCRQQWRPRGVVCGFLWLDAFSSFLYARVAVDRRFARVRRQRRRGRSWLGHGTAPLGVRTRAGERKRGDAPAPSGEKRQAIKANAKHAQSQSQREGQDNQGGRSQTSPLTPPSARHDTEECVTTYAWAPRDDSQPSQAAGPTDRHLEPGPACTHGRVVTRGVWLRVHRSCASPSVSHSVRQ